MGYRPEEVRDQEFDERAVVTAAQAGDELAIGQLYDHYLPRIFRFMYARLGSREDAEDLTAEVFFRVIDNLHRFAWRDETPFGAWLFRIARNELVSMLRRRNSQPVTRPLDDAMPLAEEDPELAALEHRAAIEEVRQASLKLTDTQRRVIELRFAAGLSVAETAKTLNKTENNVKVLQHKAIKNLRNLLNRE